MSKPDDGVVVIIGPAKKPVGMGILVDRRHVLTCAHVVSAALKWDGRLPAKPTDTDQSQGLTPYPTDPTPTDKISVIFPYSSGMKQSERTDGTVKGWHPVLESQTPRPEIHDVAVLELTEDAPEDAGVATLSGNEPKIDHSFVAGRATTHVAKLISATGFIGPKSPDGTYELRGENFIGEYVEPGFSGGSCWDKDLTCTVGMVVTLQEGGKRIAHMIPSTTLHLALKEASVGVPADMEEIDPSIQALRTKAVEHLKRCPDAVEILAKKVAELTASPSTYENNRPSYYQLIKDLQEIGCDAAFTIIIDSYFNILKTYGKHDDKLIAIEGLCYCMLPLLYRPEERKRVKVEVLSGSAFVSIPADFPTTVDIIMAGVDGRQLELHPPTNGTVFPRGKLQLYEPPEEGMDESQTKFATNFHDFLVKKFIPVTNFSQTYDEQVLSILAALTNRLNRYSYRYYYIYSLPKESTLRQQRQQIIRTLKEKYKPIAFLEMKKSINSANEFGVLDSLHDLLCLAADVKRTP